MKITIGNNKEDNYPVAVETDWTGFVSLLREMSSEGISGVNKNECKDKASGLTACTFDHDRRRLKANATAAEFFWLDCEDGEPNELAKAVEGSAALGLEAVVYTSAGHAPPADRFRIIVPLSTPIISHDDYRRVCLLLQNKLDVAVDRGKLIMYALLFQPARYSSATENVFIHLAGGIVAAKDWLSLCPPAPIPRPSVPMVPLTTANHPNGYVEAAVKGEIVRIEQAVPSHRRIDTFIAAANVTILAQRLAELHERMAEVVIECLDFEPFIRRYDRPGLLFFADSPPMSAPRTITMPACSRKRACGAWRRRSRASRAGSSLRTWTTPRSATPSRAARSAMWT